MFSPNALLGFLLVLVHFQDLATWRVFNLPAAATAGNQVVDGQGIYRSVTPPSLQGRCVLAAIGKEEIDGSNPPRSTTHIFRSRTSALPMLRRGPDPETGSTYSKR